MLLDVNLPRINGLDVLARWGARSMPPKVVIITGMDTPETILEETAFDALSRQESI